MNTSINKAFHVEQPVAVVWANLTDPEKVVGCVPGASLTEKVHEKDGGTEVNVTMDISITGMLAQFGSRMINDVNNQVFDQFIANFRAQLSGGEVDNQLKAGSLVGTAIKSIF